MIEQLSESSEDFSHEWECISRPSPKKELVESLSDESENEDEDFETISDEKNPKQKILD